MSAEFKSEYYQVAKALGLADLERVKFQREVLNSNLLNSLGTGFGKTVYEAKIAAEMQEKASQSPKKTKEAQK